MRRISVLLAVAAILLSAIVAFTYKARHERDHKRAAPTPQVGTNVAVAHQGWAYTKDDPQTNRPVVHISAQSFEATDNPSTTGLRDVALRIYHKSGNSYTYVRSQSAQFQELTGLMKSQGAVTIVMNVPADKDAEKPAEIVGLVQVQTSGVTYETNSGKAATDQPAAFKFSEGDGSATGVTYDPNTGELHLKSGVSLDWIGHGPAANKMHVEAGDLVYREKEHKIYLSPWSKLVRQQTTIAAQSSIVQLDDDGNLQRIDSEHAAGTDIRVASETQAAKQTQFAADHMTALFNDVGSMTELQGIGNAQVSSTQKTSRTKLTGDQATMRFRIDTKIVDGQPADESNLSEVIADGHAVAESDPLPQPGVKLAESHLLRSDHIDLEMMPDGKNVKRIQTPGKGQLEFKPNSPDQAHRIVDASRIDVLYGDSSYIDSFQAWSAATKTEKPTSTVKSATSKTPPPAYTWSDLLTAKFAPGSNQVNAIEQKKNFRYEEGPRKAAADTAYLDQKANLITLVQNARVSDETGSAIADKIVMNQQTGDMDAAGHVVSTHAPDPNQRPGTSMLDNTKTMQAKADNMQTRENNTRIVYSGNAVIWQGANRVSAHEIRIDRDAQTLAASGDVVSELVDNSKPDSEQTTAPLFTVVRAPEMHYRDDTRIADYTGGVALTRGELTVTSKSLEAYLTPKQDKPTGATSSANDNSSSLDHALASGDVVVKEELSNGVSRKGTAEHAEYTTKLSKVVLEGGHPEFHDSRKGFTRGRQLTYFSDEDKLIVDGAKGSPAYTQMKKH